MKNNDKLKKVAELKFKNKERRLLEGGQAMTEYIEAARTLDANTTRLKALRLTRDADQKAPLAKSTIVSPAKMKQEQSEKLAMAERDGVRVRYCSSQNEIKST